MVGRKVTIHNHDTKTTWLAAVTTQALDSADDLTTPAINDTRKDASIQDEDPDDQIVNDANILAEVRLSSTIRMLDSLFLAFPNLANIFAITYRTQVVSSYSCEKS